MKFLPENRKKTIVLVVVFLISTFGIIYVNFFTGRSTSKNFTSQSTQENLNLASRRASQTQAIPENAQVSGGLLPHGSMINLQILQDDKFTSLKSVPPVTVSPEELGKTDLFGR